MIETIISIYRYRYIQYIQKHTYSNLFIKLEQMVIFTKYWLRNLIEYRVQSIKNITTFEENKQKLQ